AFRKKMEDPDVPQQDKDKLRAERQGDLDAMRAWVTTAEPARKAAYDADAFDLPAELAMKGNSSTFLKDGKVQIKSLIGNRCLTCHGPGGRQHEEYPLTDYEKLSKYMKPFAPPADTGNGNENANLTPAPPTAPAPRPLPTRAIEPIPDAKDD
ncbi:MAG: hypothetical protein L0241_04465, partial [Planctomycetia bacterium]|nr:hypothetical protein [Planctomycetia bacterium]